MISEFHNGVMVAKKIKLLQNLNLELKFSCVIWQKYSKFLCLSRLQYTIILSRCVYTPVCVNRAGTIKKTTHRLSSVHRSRFTMHYLESYYTA